MLGLLEVCIKNSSIQYRELDGTMSVIPGLYLIVLSTDDHLIEAQGLSFSNEHVFFKQWVMFEDLGAWLLFTDFKCGVLVQWSVACTQLHLNRWAFVRYLEILMQHFNVDLSLNVVFTFFQIKGVLKRTWVSFNATPGKRLLGLFQSL